MICFFAITIYHNLASHSLLTYCFHNKKVISGNKLKILRSVIQTSYATNFFTSLLKSLGIIFKTTFSTFVFEFRSPLTKNGKLQWSNNS